MSVTRHCLRCGREFVTRRHASLSEERRLCPHCRVPRPPSGVFNLRDVGRQEPILPELVP